ncbi:hypothetical protein [Roseibium sp.]|uniref:hypothetical protein n=1 Tax=Roseibium sp. TaxID=1936156 RepID=UPI003A96A57B
MKTQQLRVLSGFVLFALFAFPSNLVAFTDAFEAPPEQQASSILEGADTGPGYLVLSPVRGDGFLRVYDVQTELGVERISGDGLLKLRLHELKVLSALRQLETEQSFLDGLKEAAKRPVGFVESTVTDPVGTAKNTLTGVGRMFGRIGKGVEQAVTGEAGSPAELAKAITGQARAKRELAVKLGVDPYTTYRPLGEALDKAASVSTAGSLSVGALLALVPGGAISQVAGTAESLRTSLIDSTRSELEERTASVLRRNRIPEPSISRLLANAYFTPAERAVVAYQTEAFSNVEGIDLLVGRAAEAGSRDEAYFQLRRIVLTRFYDEKIAGLASIRMVAGFPIALRRDGIAAVVMPLDQVAWTQETATAFSSLNEGFGSLPFPPTSVDFVMTGDITDLAAERIASMGWGITSNMPMPDGPVF